jgi:beta-lactamase superfamily II metal-dependent hydrolase
MVIVSVGPNTHGHPKNEAIDLYKKYATGARNGDKIARTDNNGTMKLTLQTAGGWRLEYNQ